MQALLDQVGTVMREVAAAEALPRWRNLADGDIAEKTGPEDVVTVADRAVEAALGPRLMALMPGSAVVGEEAVHADPAILHELHGDRAVWVIDPIDGTSAFAAGSPDFAVMVALVRDRTPIAGWILIPVRDALTMGAKGGGVWHTEGRGARRQLTPPGVRAAGLGDLRGAVGRKKTDPAMQARIQAAAPRFKSMTPAICAGIEYPRLVSGQLDFSFYNKSEPWDHLPGLAMAAELGFSYAKHDGSPYLPGDNEGGLLVAPDGPTWNAIRDALIG